MFKITYDHYTIMTIFHENLSKHINMYVEGKEYNTIKRKL